MASPETMRCLGCGYDLRGLPEDRCPECGRTFDPYSPTSYLSRLKSGRRYLLIALLAAILLITSLVATVLNDRGLVSYKGWLWDVLTLLLAPTMPVAVVVQCYVLRVSIRASRLPRDARRYPTCWFAAMIISALTIFGFIALLVSPRFM